MPPEMGKTDSYLLQSFRTLAATRDLSSENPAVTMLIRLRNPSKFVAPDGFEELSRIGNIVSGRGTLEALESLQSDSNVLGIEASRPAKTPESAPVPGTFAGRAGAQSAVVPYPLNFVRATAIHRAIPAETGDRCLVAVLDAGIDVLHQTFLDESGASRIVEVWDQSDPTGPTPRDLYKEVMPADYGSVHTADDIARYIASQSVPDKLGSGSAHGTHVASIAAGRPLPSIAAGASAGFGGGVAPGAKIVAVVTKTEADEGDPTSLGYSTTHCDALAYVRAVADKLDLPVVVNLSQGMNAGAHDGTSLLETAFDEFTGGGRDPGVAIVKAAGNERNFAGHARVALGSNMLDTLTWESKQLPRTQDVFELWFEACDEYRFTVVDPNGERAGPVTWPSPVLSQSLQNGNVVSLSYTRYHHDNGDSRLVLTVDAGLGDLPQITAGEWSLEIESGQVRSDGMIDAWAERNNSRPVVFTNHLDEEDTLTIPGTAHTVIAVGAVTAALPLWTPNFTSFGPTRDHREKPEVVAPGVNIVGADARTGSGCRIDSGTSMAAPHVTGAIALLFSHLSKKGSRLPNAAQIRAALTQQTQNFTGRFTPGGGYGVIDVQALLDTFS